MAKQRNIWKFNDDEWKAHIDDESLYGIVKKKFNLKCGTIYYESGSLSKETSWDVIVPNNKIEKVKKFIKDNT
tara:strand:- start:271 stop:489 length:219 start_codon:yes stop_codon:yes gene_type:complete